MGPCSGAHLASDSSSELDAFLFIAFSNCHTLLGRVDTGTLRKDVGLVELVSRKA